MSRLAIKGFASNFVSKYSSFFSGRKMRSDLFDLQHQGWVPKEKKWYKRVFNFVNILGQQQKAAKQKVNNPIEIFRTKKAFIFSFFRFQANGLI